MLSSEASVSPSGWRPRGRSPQGGARPRLSFRRRGADTRRGRRADPLPPRRREARSRPGPTARPAAPAPQAQRAAGPCGARGRALPVRCPSADGSRRRAGGLLWAVGLGRPATSQSSVPAAPSPPAPAPRGRSPPCSAGVPEGRWGGALHRSPVSASSRAWRVASFGDSYPRHGPLHAELSTCSACLSTRCSGPQRRWSFWS